MKKLIPALLLAPALVWAEPVKVIFDTDMLTDFDDVGALACLHALADAGEAEILATVSSTRGNASVGAAAPGVANEYTFDSTVSPSARLYPPLSYESRVVFVRYQ